MIKNLLFDLGGVIMDIRKESCIEAFEALGLRDAGSYFGEYEQSGPFAQLESGAISADRFHELMRAALPAGTSDDAIDRAFCRFLVGIPAHRLRALRELRRRYRIFLLSNTNPIMWNSTIAAEFTKEGLTREDYFDGMVTSFEAKAMKPDPTIFSFAIDKLGIDPEETLFLDDSQRNLSAAAAMQFATALVTPPAEFAEIIARNIAVR